VKQAVVRILIGMLALVLTPVLAFAESGGVSANGKPVTFDVQPAVVENVVMVPIRAVAEALGGQVDWNHGKSTATIATGTATVEFTVGKAQARIGGREVNLAAPAVLRGGRMLVPASFLLTYYGSQISVTHPALKDPTAMDLLHRSVSATPTHTDLQMKQAITFSVTGPVTQQGVMTVTMQGKVRGQETLMLSTLESAQIPGGAMDSQIAIKGGRAYMKAGPAGWQEIAADLAKAQALQSISGAKDIVAMVKETHLGASRDVNGQARQDVVVTYDLAVMKALTDQLLKSALPADASIQLSLGWENLTATMTLDRTTGRLMSETMDAAVSMAATVKGQTMNMHMVLHMEMAMTQSTQPIVWPADLPQ